MTAGRAARRHALLALGEGRPLGPVLRALPRGAVFADAAAAAEAGDLPGCLARLRVPPDLARLAAAWPRALPAADARLRALPSPRLAALPLLQALGWLVLVGLVQALALDSAHRAVAELELEVALLPAARLALLTALAALLASAVVLRLAAAGRAPGADRHHRLARQAALCAALAETEAPAEARVAATAGFDRLVDPAGGVEELDLVVEAALARAAAAEARVATAVRVGGLALLAVNAALGTGALYRALAELPWAT